MLVGSIYTPSAVVWGAIPVGLAMLGWLYPRTAESPVPLGARAEERTR
jgi:hypothetical protein